MGAILSHGYGEPTKYLAIGATREAAISNLVVKIHDSKPNYQMIKVCGISYVENKYTRVEINIVYIASDGEADCYRAEVTI